MERVTNFIANYQMAILLFVSTTICASIISIVVTNLYRKCGKVTCTRNDLKYDYIKDIAQDTFEWFVSLELQKKEYLRFSIDLNLRNTKDIPVGLEKVKILVKNSKYEVEHTPHNAESPAVVRPVGEKVPVINLPSNQIVNKQLEVFLSKSETRKAFSDEYIEIYLTAVENNKKKLWRIAAFDQPF